MLIRARPLPAPSVRCHAALGATAFTMLLWLAQSLAITVMVCVIVTNWLVVKSAEFLQGVIRKLYR